MTARRNPVKAPRNPSVIERLLNVRRPWPVRRNPVYAIVTVHKIARTFMVRSHLGGVALRGRDFFASGFHMLGVALGMSEAGLNEASA